MFLLLALVFLGWRIIAVPVNAAMNGLIRLLGTIV
jgi:hypothetical protein